MKRINAFFAGLICIMLSFSGCRSYISSQKGNADKRTIYFTINGENARIATADYSWSDFSYRLKAKVGNSSDSKIIVPVSGSGYATKAEIFTGHELALASYEFTLEAYNSSHELLFQSTPVSVDLSTAAATVNFVMYPAGTKKGGFNIKLKFPKGDVVKSVKCFVKGIDSQEEKNSMIATSFGTDGSYNVVNYSVQNLEAGYNNVAVFQLNDANGTCIASRMESVVIIGGMQSTSEIVLAETDYKKYDISMALKKDGSQWGDSKKQVLLVPQEDLGQANPRTIILTELKANATFHANIADIPYYIFVKDLSETSLITQPDYGVNINVPYQPSENGLINDLEMYTVKLPTRGVSFTPVSGGIYGGTDDDGNDIYYVAKNQTLQVKVDVKNGYSNASVGIDGKTCANGGTASIGPIINAKTVTITSVQPQVYTIRYETNGGTVKNSANFKQNYTVEDTVKLPVYTDLEAPSGYILDGWEDATGNRLATILPGTTGNKVFTACYKEMAVKPAEPAPEDEGKTAEEAGNFEDFKIYPSICASGFSLIVQWKNNDPATKITEVYVDYDSDGIIDTEDIKITGSANPDTTDFTGYILRAEKPDNSDKPASDFTFTIKGGSLAALEGLGAAEKNISTVNISGVNTHIGGVVDGKKTGVKLSTLTNEIVNISGQLSGNYAITLISNNKFTSRVPYRDIVSIANSTWVQLKNVTCLYGGATADGVATGSELELAVRDVKNSSGTVTKSYIYLRNPASIGLPDSSAPGDNIPGGIIWITQPTGEVSKTEFTLGDSASISIKCSVFSVKVENGTFMLTDTRMKDETGAYINTVNNMAQINSTTYRENEAINTTDRYVYMHMMSEGNELTPYTATEFLKTIHFIKSSESSKIKLTVHLEEVPYSEIQKMQNTTETFVIPSTNAHNATVTRTYKRKAFNYYNGSFYLGMVDTKSCNSSNAANDTYISWPDAYNFVKSNMVFNGLNGYLVNVTTQVENDYITGYMKLGDSWTGGSRLENTNGFDSESFNIKDTTKAGGYNEFYWQSGPEAGKVYWNSRTSTGSAQNGYLKNWMRNEPNNSPGSRAEQTGKGETCMQLVAIGTTVNGWTEKMWNDLAYCNFRVHGFIIEYTPYSNAYGKETPLKASVECVAEY